MCSSGGHLSCSRARPAWLCRSGDVEATSAPSLQLICDVIEVVDALPDELFDRHAEHRPCGLLDRAGAYGMLIGDVLGLPLLPWILAEPVGKAAAKLKKKIPEKKKEVKKKAKRKGSDPEAAAVALLVRRVGLELPQADEIKATARRIARAAAQPPEPPPPEAPLPPALEPAMPAEHTCSDECTAEELCPRAQALVDAAMSEEAAHAIAWAYEVASLRRAARNTEELSTEREELETADWSFQYALRRLLRVYPTEFGGQITQDSKAECVVGLTVKLASFGHVVPMAEQAAREVGFDLQAAVSRNQKEMV